MDIKKIKIEGIPFDFALIVKQLKQDMRDEWFPDSINYEDALDAESLAVKFGKYGKSKDKSGQIYFLPLEQVETNGDGAEWH